MTHTSDSLCLFLLHSSRPNGPLDGDADVFRFLRKLHRTVSQTDSSISALLPLPLLNVLESDPVEFRRVLNTETPVASPSVIWSPRMHQKLQRHVASLLKAPEPGPLIPVAYSELANKLCVGGMYLEYFQCDPQHPVRLAMSCCCVPWLNCHLRNPDSLMLHLAGATRNTEQKRSLELICSAVCTLAGRFPHIAACREYPACPRLLELLLREDVCSAAASAMYKLLTVVGGNNRAGFVAAGGSECLCQVLYCCMPPG